MAGEWVDVQLGEVSELLTGFPFKSEHYTEESTAPRLLRGDNVGQGVLRWDGAKRWPSNGTAEVSQYWLGEGDVILAMDRPWIEAGLKYASVRRSDLPSLLVQRVARLRGTDRLDIGFLKFLIGSQAFTDHVLAVQTGTAVPHISGDQIKSFEFCLPPLPEQRAIAHILGTLDDKIELNRRMSDTLEAMARALFKSWFVDFDPVRTKAEGRDTGLPKPLAELFPDRLVDSVLDEIPKGWEAKPLGDWADALSGGTPAKTEARYWNGEIPWISPKVMTSIHADEADAYVANSAIGNGTRLIDAGTTLVMVRGMGLHEKVRVCQARVDLTFNQDVKALVGTSIDCTLLFFAMLDAQRNLLDHVESSGHGTGKLPTDVLLSFRIVMPTRTIQRRLSEPFQVMNERIGTARSESRSLAALRDSLLPKLISGELRVKDADRFVSSVSVYQAGHTHD